MNEETARQCLDVILGEALARKASDVHLACGQPPLVRVDGDMVRLEQPPCDAPMLDALMDVLLQGGPHREAWGSGADCDAALTWANRLRVRVNAYRTLDGACAALRLIPLDVPEWSSLGVPEKLMTLTQRRQGLILIAGPTGSGKSTTLAALVQHLHQTQAGHILTIEDPIEFVHGPGRGLISQREVGLHTPDFASALRMALRETPDVIVIGDMRDRTTFSQALRAAETGHLVLGTLHAPSAARTVDRILDAFEGAERSSAALSLSGCLSAILVQRLVRRKGGGRVALHELLLATPAVRSMIRDSHVAQLPAAIETGRSVGMQSIAEAAARLVANGTLDMATAQMVNGA
ncbi:MAG: PilT/PilU family type 4a pilus ATPase [Alphaproteobacteria bacterium]|nr:MAG: PilT/PilU family type 4a pilus ATPase [Alphaproteobacteria bacterium]